MKPPLIPLDHVLFLSSTALSQWYDWDKDSRMSMPGFITRLTLTPIAAAFYLAIKHRADIGVSRLREVTCALSLSPLVSRFSDQAWSSSQPFCPFLYSLYSTKYEPHSKAGVDLKLGCASSPITYKSSERVPFFLSTWLYIYPENKCTNLRSVRTKIALLESISHIELSFTVCIWEQGILLLCGCLDREYI